MGISELILLLLVVFIILDFMFLAVYCKLMEIVNRRKAGKNRAEQNINSENKEDKTNQSILNKLLHNIYVSSYPYFYGLLRYTLLMVGEIPSHRFRKFLYKNIFRMKITKKTVINGGCEIRSPWNIKTSNCVIGVGCILDGRSGIEIGENVVFGQGVHIWTEEHNANDPYFRVMPENAKPVIIEKHAWICSDSTILPGVRIGEGVVVASRACVTEDCEAFGIYGGVPAKKISERNHELLYELNGKPHWHFY